MIYPTMLIIQGLILLLHRKKNKVDIYYRLEHYFVSIFTLGVLVVGYTEFIVISKIY